MGGQVAGGLYENPSSLDATKTEKDNSDIGCLAIRSYHPSRSPNSWPSAEFGPNMMDPEIVDFRISNVNAPNFVLRFDLRA